MTTFIFGHKIPDTDSVTSAISLSYLKNKLGMKTEPRVLGEISKETNYILDHFGVKAPEYIEDVRVQLKDLKLENTKGISADTSISETFKLMERDDVKILSIVDEEKHLMGVVTMKDIALGIVSKNVYRVKNTLKSINEDLEGKILVNAQEEIDGNIKIAAFYHETLQGQLTQEDVVITGDRYEIFKQAIDAKIELLVITGGIDVPKIYLESAKENGVSIILVNEDTFTISKRINQCSKISSIMNEKVFKFSDYENLIDVKDEIEESKIRNFPVTDKNNVFLGFINKGHVLNPQRKNVILVDHNEYEQSAEGLREANIIEVVDHHKIGNISTSMPISFRNAPVGSTCTIIYNMFKESGIEVPYEIAGMLISGIISDTLLFRSPTTTEVDREVVKQLNKILKLDLDEYAMDVFKAGTSLEGYTIEEIFYRDFKQFEIQGNKIGVGQVFTLNIEEILDRKEEYLDFMSEAHEKNEYYLTILILTDILKEGSYMLFKSSKSNIIKRAFDVEEEQGVFIDGLVSRKKQVVPNITKAIHL